MDYFLILKVAGCAVLWICVICCQIQGYFRLQHEKEIFKRGHRVQGKIVKIHYQLINRSLAREHNCTPVVSFNFEYTTYKLSTSNTVPYRAYAKGSEIELLFLPEYPKCVVVPAEKPTSPIGYLVDSIILLALSVLLVIASSHILGFIQ